MKSSFLSLVSLLNQNNLYHLLNLYKLPFYTFTYTPYKYYELAIQKWCQSDYQIHGLWPQYDADTWPSNCPAPAYQTIIDPTLLNEMNTVWHNCDSSSQDFWNHEYTKHLSCMYQQYGFTENESFQIAINLFTNLNKSDFDKCGGEDDCIVACYDLELNKITCP
jgi:hypothetical protein